ncbi:VOC family protein [Psychrobium sp. 1_MG-2023]|uniref:VOC family protein n=1 Tax=Psychrobium sp. 1_MG-2023 TaxID=3062624 RepID=UPI000C33D5D1|nr:VOC family protein [Psychrobium sp. 1_MG-2023]MDP2561137.1 VOC family protein [Psychrobium sp. 1_MG-2023]PKF55113.1 glyoxalase [Alteromonadales bacterium alter-6D02]
MLYLEHLNLVVQDIPRALKFYQAAFPHWQIRGGGDSEWYGTPRSWVHFGDDYQYLTFNDSGTGENRNLMSNQLGLSHFAFVTSSLDAIVARLNEAGFDIAKPGAEDPYRKNVYFVDPDGYEVEFVEYLSDIPSQRNLYQ